MKDDIDIKIKKRAQNLRKNMTKEEKHLWYDFLKPLPFVFKRQQRIGYYIVDFYCASKKVIIELDGSQHYDEKNVKYDKIRDTYLKEQGNTILRYSNADINMRFDSVCNDILGNLETPHQSLRDSFPQGGSL